MKQFKRGDLSLTNWHLSSVPAHAESPLPRTYQEPNHTMPTFLGFKAVHSCVYVCVQSGPNKDSCEHGCVCRVEPVKTVVNTGVCRVDPVRTVVNTSVCAEWTQQGHL